MKRIINLEPRVNEVFEFKGKTLKCKRCKTDDDCFSCALVEIDENGFWAGCNNQIKSKVDGKLFKGQLLCNEDERSDEECVYFVETNKEIK